MKNDEAEYLTWLVKKMNVVPHKNYGMLLRELYRWEFWSNVPHDEDRGSDGIALRGVWANEIGYEEYSDFGPARVLETFIGIAIRIEDKIFGRPLVDEWDYKRIFWDLINNLGLINYDGVLNSEDYDKVGVVLERFLHKKGNCDTFPNIFVFFDTPKNLRKLNLWSQIGVYIGEKWPGNMYL